jgi:hypothetical protein
MASQYEKGVEAEERVARSLRARGAKVTGYPGSKGPGARDLRAVFPRGTAWGVQVKTVKKGEAPSLSPEERRRLSGIKDTPVVAIVPEQGPVQFIYPSTNQPVRFPKKGPPNKRK